MIGGMILFDKPPGWTSHDAAEAFRRMLPGGTKVGHCGALDPLATGLLVLLVGPGTRLQARMQGLDKSYSGVIRLGLSTDTGDITGKVVRQRPVPELDLAAVQKAMDALHGSVDMEVPVFSAVKHKGRALYKYARRGQAVPPIRRTSKVYEWRASSFAAPDVEHVISCSSGTYVRSLAQVLGERLGCGGTVAALRRDRIANLNLSEAITREQAGGMSAEALRSLLEASWKRLQSVEFAPPFPAARP